MRLIKLPPWNLTNKLPAFHDVESASSVQMTAKLYDYMKAFGLDYEKFVEEINTAITEYNTDMETDQKCFEEKITKTIHDYIHIIDTKLAHQDREIEEAISYIKENLEVGITSILEQMKESGELTTAITNAFDELGTRVTELELDITEINTNLGTANQNIYNNENRIISLEERATGVEERAAGLEERTTTLEGSKTTLEGDVTSLEDRTVALEDRTSSLEDRSTNNENTLLSLTREKFYKNTVMEVFTHIDPEGWQQALSESLTFNLPVGNYKISYHVGLNSLVDQEGICTIKPLIDGAEKHVCIRTTIPLQKGLYSSGGITVYHKQKSEQPIQINFEAYSSIECSINYFCLYIEEY